MSDLQFVTLLYSFIFLFWFVCLHVYRCACARVCVCARLWDIWRPLLVFHTFLRIISQVSTLSQHIVRCRTCSVPSSSSEVCHSVFHKRKPATHDVCVAVWSIYDYMHHLCIYHGIANKHKHIYLFILLFKVQSFNFLHFSFSQVLTEVLAVEPIYSTKKRRRLLCCVMFAVSTRAQPD